MHFWDHSRPSLSTAAPNNDRSRSQTDLNQSDDQQGGVETGSPAEEDRGNIPVSAEHVDEVADSGEAEAISGKIPSAKGRSDDSENPSPFYQTLGRFPHRIQDSSLDASQAHPFNYVVEHTDEGSGPGGGSRRFEAQHTDSSNFQGATGYGNLSYPGLQTSHRSTSYNQYPLFQPRQNYLRGFDTSISHLGHHRDSSSSFSQLQHGDGAAAGAAAAAAVYGSSGGAQSLHQQQQQLQLSGVPQVATDVQDAADPSSWRIQGSGSQPDSASPSSASTGDKPERRKRKSEAEETPAKPYACRFCSQSFDKSQALGGHMNRHRQEREREQLDNAQKLVLKQQGLQGLPGGLTGLPMQNLNPLAKMQGPSPLLLDQATLRYNQALQYQSSRTFLPGTTYSTLHPGSLQNSGSWNLGSYLMGGTSAIASSQIEASGTSNVPRMVQATQDDMFAASLLQSARVGALPNSPSSAFSNMAPSSYNMGRANPALETGGSDLAGLGISPYDQRALNLNAGQGVQLMCNTVEPYGMGAHTSTVNEGQQQSAAALECDNMGTLQHSPPGGGMVQGTLSTSPSAGSATSGEMYEQRMASTPSPPLGRSSDPRDSHPQQDMMYGYSGVSTLTQTEVSTSGSERSATQPPYFSNLRHGFHTVPQGPSVLGGMHLYQGGAAHGSQLPAASTPPEQLLPDSAPAGQNSPGASTEGLVLHPWMLGERKPGLLVAEPAEVLSPSVTSSLTPRAGGPAERMRGERGFSVLRDSATELDTSGYIKVDDSNAVVDYTSEPEAENNTSYDTTRTTSEQSWRSGSASPSM